MNEHQDAPHNPSFVVTIMNRSPIGDLTTYGNDSFSIEMYAPLHYPLWGNFVVWRDGERLWDIEPTQLEMYIKGTPMIETVLIRPGTGYLFTFDMVDNFPNHHEATQNFSIPRKEILSFSSLQTQHVKPFTTAGTYQIAFELLLPSFHKEGPLFQNRIRSNTLNYTLQ